MKEVESLMIKYVGYKEPATPDEVALEILGLHTAIAACQQRIAVLEQSMKLQEIVQHSKNLEAVRAQAEKAKEETDDKTVEEAAQPEEVEQQG